MKLPQWGETFIYFVIIVNTIVIYLQVKGNDTYVLNLLDALCTMIYIVEMIIKLNQYNILKLLSSITPNHRDYGHYSFAELAKLSRNAYWRDNWNKMDAILVLLSLPALFLFFFPDSFNQFAGSLSFVLAVRLLRIMRVFKSIRFFGADAVNNMFSGLRRAMKMSRSILGIFVIVIFVFGLINCSLFKDLAPNYFSSPMVSIYSVFRLFTVEGWYDIPDTIITGAIAKNVFFTGLDDVVRLYFCALLIVGGIFGMSFINSVFVDAMVEDNNDEIIKMLKDLKQQNAELSKQVDELHQQLNS